MGKLEFGTVSEWKMHQLNDQIFAISMLEFLENYIHRFKLIMVVDASIFRRYSKKWNYQSITSYIGKKTSPCLLMPSLADKQLNSECHPQRKRMGPKSWVLLFLRRLVRAPQLIH
jgi:hypothetical protein